MADGVRATSAPGKLVLAGEYAVLDGHNALVAAVSARAVARRFDASTVLLQGSHGAPLDPVADRDLAVRTVPLLVTTFDAVIARGTTPQVGRYQVDTSAFALGGIKVGIGSSAAATVALVQALLPSASRSVVHQIARSAHRTFQGGGSGIDVAASTYGGLLQFAAHADDANDVVVTEAPPLPRALVFLAVFVGHATRTQGFVDAYRALPDRERHALAIATACEAVRRACEANDAGAVVAALHAARITMGQMGDAAGIDVVSARHQQLADMCQRFGGAAKPSGAGGGDVGLCAVPLEHRDALKAAAAEADMTPLDLHIGAPGVRIDA